jgi:hypothetical protein
LLFDFRGLSRKATVDAWRGALDITPHGSDSVLTTIADAAFEPGKVYTVVVVGNARTSPKIEAFMIEDRFGAPARASAQVGQ